MNEFLYFLKEGFFHVFNWNAYDHILFLIVLTLIYVFNDWKKVFWLITIFAIGHTLTLLLSVYKVVIVNNHFVEFFIPFTILIVAIYNVFTAGKSSRDSRNNLNMIFALFFGLIHGLGFVSSFMSVVGSNNKLISSIEFGLGIELGQILAVVIIMFIGYIFQLVFRFSKRDWNLVISSIIIGLVIPILIANKIW